MISFAEFQKLEIKMGRIVSAEKIPDSKKLIKIVVDIGGEMRQLVAGVAAFYAPEHLTGKEIPVVVNLEPKSFQGYESQGMMLAADVGGRPVLLHPDEDIPPGSRVR